MDYFDILDFEKEPFSNSPDPEFFYQARPHVECLQKLELSLRLRRGLNVVTGEVGTGKTTLCRHLIRKFAGDDKVETHLVLDPSYSSPMEFLHAVAKMFCPSQSTDGLSEWQLKEMIKEHLFRTGVDEKKTVILLIDEGQRLPEYCLEILREFLNYETNEYKLLQMVIFAQTEFDETLEKCRGFADRINLYHPLGPLDFEETKSLIRFRLERASKGKANASLISPCALRVIYKASGGYPRRTIHLCHQVVLAIIIQNRSKAGWFTARSCAKRFVRGEIAKSPRTRKAILIALLVLTVIVGLGAGGLKLLEFRGRTNKPLSPLTVKQDAGTRPPAISPMASDPALALTEKTGVSEGPRTEPIAVERKTQGAPGESHDASAAAGRDAAGETASDEAGAIPHSLGKLTVTHNQTLADMIRRVYGSFNEQRLKSVCVLNKIDNPNHIEREQSIVFPCFPVKPSGPVCQFCWLQAAEKQSLEQALHYLRSSSGDPQPLSMVPTWTRHDGLQFHILYKEPFPDEESARRFLSLLPPETASEATVLVDWGQDRVFFRDPFS